MEALSLSDYRYAIYVAILISVQSMCSVGYHIDIRAWQYVYPPWHIRDVYTHSRP